MSPMHQNVAGAVGDDVPRALQEMSSEYVRRALKGELESTTAVEAAQDEMALQDTLHGHPPTPVRRRENRAGDLAADAVGPARAPLSDSQRLARTPPRARTADPQTSGTSRRPTGARSAPSAPSKKSRTAPAPARTIPVSTAPPAPASRARRLVADGPGVPELLRRDLAEILEEARGMTPVERDRLLIAARSALRTLQTGSYPTSITRPAGDRAHHIIKGIERLQLVTPLVPPTLTKDKKKENKKSKGAIAVSGAKLAPEVRKQLNDDAHARANAARMRPLDEDERLLLRSRTPIYRSYGAPVSGGLPGLSTSGR